MEYQIRCGLQSVNPHFFVSFSLQSLLYSLSRTYAKYIWKCTKKPKTHLRGNIAWARRVSWFPQVYCQTPTHLVQRRSELWHLHHANWCVYISMWTSLCWCAELECAFKSWFERTHCCLCVCVCVGEIEWPCVLFSGLWLFGGQCWCGLCLREWIYHLQPYRELHPLGWLFHSEREKFLPSLSLLVFAHY